MVRKKSQAARRTRSVMVEDLLPPPDSVEQQVEQPVEAARQSDEGDDCGVYDDEDCDDVDYEETDMGIAEEECNDFETQFGVRHDEPEGSDADAESVDEIWDDERIPDPLSSDDEAEFEHDEDNGQPQEAPPEDPNELLQLGKCFGSISDFKIAILKYSLKTRYDIKLYRSQALNVGAKCSDTDVNCPWRCYASYEKKKQKIQIKVFVNEHVCVRSGHTKMLKQGTITWLFADRLLKNPKLTKYEMAEEIMREYNLVVSDEACGKAKTQLAKQRKASHEAHFARIWDYQAEILQSNRGSTFEIETIPGPTVGSKQRFYRLYICFRAQRDAWKHTCQPIIGIDGAFLKWDIKGHLLAAVGRDGDNMIVPIAWAVVEIENDDNWDWFIQLLGKDLGVGDGGNVAIISDKQKGLVKAVHKVLPQAEHRQCARHIMDNWKRDTHDIELQLLFWKIARSYTEGEFLQNMDELKKYNPHSYTTLQYTTPRSWSRAFFRAGSCCNDVLNNLSESFNRTIRQARKKPLLDMLEDIRRQCMVRNEKRAIIAGRLKLRFTKRAHDEIEKMIEGAKHCDVYMARNNLHQVEIGAEKYRVDMNERTCGCRKWQIDGIPCVHAAAVIIRKRQKVGDYAHACFTTATWRLTYRDGIEPVQGQLLWPRTNRLPVLPPPWRRPRGRPKGHARKKGVNETSSSNTRLSRSERVMTCSKCKQDGHNKRSCKNEVVSVAKRPRGRPRKIQEPREVLFGQGQPLSQGQSSQTSRTSDGWRPWF